MIRKTKKFIVSLQKLSIVVEELISIVILQFSHYKPLYKISNFTVNGLSLHPNEKDWADAIKYFLAQLKHLRDFVLRVVN